jgi:DNA invertase Pin-like site-specific DNA recombinase
MANALVVRRNKLPSSTKSVSAAQYVRMSTDHQRYSIQNQAAAIAAYAASHNLTIVRTFADRGESGLRIKNRGALVELIDLVGSGEADFSYILVYDVSRWGRFQDIDESAHYEFICRQAGVKVIYCAEQFDNDGTLLSSIVKNLKRVMAAEYSRELSIKVHAGQCRVSSLGFWPGATPPYALCRELVDPNMKSKGLMKRGDRKCLQMDRVRLRPGSSAEVALVQWIFHQYAIEKVNAAEIARRLNKSGIVTHHERAWNNRAVLRLVRNEKYIGNLVFNRTSRFLRQRLVNNPPHLWVKAERAVEPIVDQGLFLKAKKVGEERRVDISEDEMLSRLRATFLERGHLSTNIIEETPGLPSTPTYRVHFGTLRKAYALVGFATQRDCDWIDSADHWAQVMAEVAGRIAAVLEKAGRQIDRKRDCDSILINGRIGISYRLVRETRRKNLHHSPIWTVNRRKIVPPGWVVGIRLDEAHKNVRDYLLLPTTVLSTRTTKLTERGLARHSARIFKTVGSLARSIVSITSKPSSVSTKLTRSKRDRETSH